MSGNIQMLNVN